MLLLPIPGSLSSCLHSIASFRFVSVLGTSCSFVAGCKCPLLVCMTALTGSWSLNSFSSYGACRGSAVPLSQLDVLLTVCSPVIVAPLSRLICGELKAIHVAVHTRGWHRSHKAWSPDMFAASLVSYGPNALQRAGDAWRIALWPILENQATVKI